MVLQIGKTKVFLRAGQMAELDARRAQKLATAAKTIQRKVRTHITRKYFLALQKAAICLQSSCRGLSIYIFFYRSTLQLGDFVLYFLDVLRNELGLLQLTGALDSFIHVICVIYVG